MRDLSSSDLQLLSGGLSPDDISGPHQADVLLRSIGTVASAFGYMGGIRSMQMLGIKAHGTVGGTTTAVVIGGIATPSAWDLSGSGIDQRIYSGMAVSMTCGAMVGVAEGLVGAAISRAT